MSPISSSIFQHKCCFVSPWLFTFFPSSFSNSFLNWASRFYLCNHPHVCPIKSTKPVRRKFSRILQDLDICFGTVLYRQSFWSGTLNGIDVRITIPETLSYSRYSLKWNCLCRRYHSSEDAVFRQVLYYVKKLRKVFPEDVICHVI